MVRIALLALAAIALSPRPAAHAEPTVTLRLIVNAKSHESRLDKHFVADAFLKKRTHWDDDSGIQPVDLGEKSTVRDRFSHDILGRDIGSVRRYWAQLVFSGRGVPPPELGTESEIVKYVAAHRGAIGYVSASADLTGVKIVEVD